MPLVGYPRENTDSYDRCFPEGTQNEEKGMSEDRQTQMMLSCAFCGEATTPPSVTGGLLTIRSEEGRVGAFAFHSRCAMERMHPRARALLAEAPIIPLPD